MNYEDLSDRELLGLCADGNQQAWNFFIEKYSKRVYKAIHITLRKYSSDYLREDVEDIYSQVFLSLLDDNCRRLKQFRGERNNSAVTWLSVIAMNRTLNYITRTKTHASLDDESETAGSVRSQLPSSQPPVLKRLSDAQERRLLKELIEQLTSREQLMLKYHLDGLSSKAIGSIIGKSQNAVDSQISRIRKKLKDIADTL